MILRNKNAEKIFLIKDVPEKINCEDCKVCVKLRLMELGLMPESLVELTKHHSGLWIVNLLNSFGQIESTIALRKEEIERIILKNEGCSFTFEPYY